jgi:hypothetical protein
MWTGAGKIVSGSTAVHGRKESSRDSFLASYNTLAHSSYSFLLLVMLHP